MEGTSWLMGSDKGTILVNGGEVHVGNIYAHTYITRGEIEGTACLVGVR